MFWILSSGFSSFLGANLLLVQYYSVISCCGINYDNYNGMYVLYTRIGPIILGLAESAMPWVYCYLPMMLDK